MADPIVIIQAVEQSVQIIRNVIGSVATPLNDVTIKSTGIQGPPGPPGVAGTQGNRDYKLRNSDYYVNLATDGFLAIDASNGLVNVYLPVSDNSNKGALVTIKKLDSTSYIVDVQTQMGQTIDGSLVSFHLTDENDCFDFNSTGSGYDIS